MIGNNDILNIVTNFLLLKKESKYLIREIKLNKINNIFILQNRLCYLSGDLYYEFNRFLWNQFFKELFIRFLKENNIFQKYINNKKVSFYQINCCQQYYCLMKSFNFYQSNENWDFWHYYNIKWCKIVDLYLLYDF